MELLVENVSIQIDNTEIIKEICLSAQTGEFVGLIGPNGSGKSTLLKAIYRILNYNKGEITLNGQSIKAISLGEMAKQMAVVGQFNNINFELTLLEIVMMGRNPYLGQWQRESEKDYEIAWEALEKVGMAQVAHRHFSSLSGGEKQRVILARALTQQPKVLILDEPTNHLDIKYQIEILSIVKQLGICTVAALHDLSLAAQFCDEIYIIKKGEVVTKGKPQEVITREMVKAIYEIDCDIVYNEKTQALMISYYPTIGE